MALKREKLAELVRPYVRARCLTFDAFDEIFDKQLHLPKQVQYQAAETLHTLGVELVDELPPEDAADADRTEDDAGAEEDADAEDDDDEDGTFDDEDSEDDAPFEEGSGPASFDDVAIPPEALVDPRLRKMTNEMLCVRIKAGDHAALAALWEKNKRLVYQQAWLFWKRHPKGPAVDDLAMAGVIGFLKAAERFDESQGRFTTYAVLWLRQSMTRCYEDEGTLIRLPVHMHEKLNKVMRLDREFEQAGEHDAAARRARIAARLAWTREDVAKVQALRALAAPTSLDLPVGAEADTSLGDFLPDITTPSVEDQVLHADTRDFLAKLLAGLKPREAEVLRLRFGLDDGHARTLEEVGEQMGVTRERIRQIESKALRKLRGRIGWLKQQDYLEG
ncbi:RNA polymerase sigma factor RpoD/SigA [uncultured Selenomonas sp.]|uniref:sigma-70 family RNA polymerase sigma factor n=1 Tax=uncultured Selenomonas sp. TaxID=159275 RepID=UPI0025CDF527|nr:RNA polymerase sigma factor RpoD/SigA [uncultured Selenomonas sp.]